MLAAIRNKSKGIVAYFIVGIIAIPMALFGINQYFEGNYNTTVATINGNEISQNEYLQLFTRQQRALQEQLGDNYTLQIENQIKQSVVSSLINEKLLEELATELGLATTETEVKQEILSDTNFYKDGKFDLENYQTLLRLNGYNPSTYEALVAKNKTNTQLQSNLLSASFLTPSAKKQLSDLINQERKIAYVEFKNNDFADKIQINDTQIEEYFNANQGSFNNPQQIKVDFVELNTDSLIDAIIVDDATLQAFFDENKDNYTNEEERSASHILVEEKVLADDIKAKLNSGESFESLAKKHSIDDSNADNGGNLGFFGKGVMVPEFEKQVFAMNVGEISPPIKTEFGYHIIKLNNIKAESVKSFASVKDEIEFSYKINEAKKQIFALSEKMQNIAYDGTLEDIADELNLAIQTTDFITNNTEDLDKKFITAAFSKDIIDGENLVVELSSDKVVAMRKNEFIPASKQTLEQATPLIKTILTTQESAKLSKQAAQQVIDSKSFKEGVWRSRQGDEHTAENIADVINFAFSISHRDDINYGLKTFNDKAIAVEVSGVRVAANNEQNLDGLNTSYNDQIFNDILTYLRNSAEIQVYQNRL